VLPWSDPYTIRHQNEIVEVSAAFAIAGCAFRSLGHILLGRLVASVVKKSWRQHPTTTCWNRKTHLLRDRVVLVVVSKILQASKHQPFLKEIFYAERSNPQPELSADCDSTLTSADALPGIG
jgi:hypothetical protein